MTINKNVKKGKQKIQNQLLFYEINPHYRNISTQHLEIRLKIYLDMKEPNLVR